jgi:hypothetical protein
MRWRAGLQCVAAGSALLPEYASPRAAAGPAPWSGRVLRQESRKHANAIRAIARGLPAYTLPAPYTRGSAAPGSGGSIGQRRCSYSAVRAASTSKRSAWGVPGVVHAENTVRFPPVPNRSRFHSAVAEHPCALHRHQFDLIVLRPRADEFHEYPLESVRDTHNRSIPIAVYIENQALVSNEIDRGTELPFDVRRAGSLRPAPCRMPRAK